MIVNTKNIASLSDQDILETRICDLKLPLRNVDFVVKCYQQLRQELQRNRILCIPHIWVSDEWYSPDGVSGFAVPFYLLHPRLVKLAEEHIFVAEGSTPSWCMKLMRHEMGHVMDNAYLLRRRRQRQKLFGLSSTPYPQSYSPRPYSNKYVKNLDSWYAQAHPDEDWAETFAVWLNPNSKWRSKYKTGEVRLKLNYMDELMSILAGQKPARNLKKVDVKASQIKETVLSYFENKKATYQEEDLGFFDDELKRIFTFDRTETFNLRGHRFIESRRTKIRNIVGTWTGQDRYKINFVLDFLVERSQQMNLFLKHNHEDTLLQLVSMLSVRTTSFLSSGRYRISL